MQVFDADGDELAAAEGARPSPGEQDAVPAPGQIVVEKADHGEEIGGGERGLLRSRSDAQAVANALHYLEGFQGLDLLATASWVG